VGKICVVRGEGERYFNRRLTRLVDAFTSHTGWNDPFSHHLFPHPQTSRLIIFACLFVVGTAADIRFKQMKGLFTGIARIPTCERW